MRRMMVVAAGFALVAAEALSQTLQKQGPVPPALAEFLKMDADQVLQRYDRNGDGVLSRKEFPPRLSRLFDRADTNGDGKLSYEEIDRLLHHLRQRFGLTAGGATASKKRPLAKESPAVAREVDDRVARILRRLDTNGDGKISREEAKGPLAENFERIDVNRDGFMDRQELRQAVVRRVQNRKAGSEASGPRAGKPDFDDLDANADGRLTPEELKGTPWESHFNEIDTNRDGKVDRKEFEAFTKKQAAEPKK